ncbi:iron ABC transporter ATP-binding protein [Bordetella genomosp. 9]|uniref:ABC transporter ATP-binding protein n=1 Tax=Bordetella genomosp. 9 TaxID=1416803 RepID=UPI000A2967E4|nr:ABC transporter ATP-binding protein [Bordetella genomosp. 9]ARP89550.1 iron ABC transporter ATP-binding protein [Bordetella genomosp. 9]
MTLAKNRVRESGRRPGLTIQGLRAGYGRHDVIQDLNLEALRPGEITAVLGPNGSGKSSLLKAIAGLISVREGCVALDGETLTSLSPAARSRLVAYMPQDLPAAVHLRVLEAVRAAARAPNPDNRSPGPAAAHALLARMGIAHLALRHLDELSGGQRQLAGLALALVRDPRVLLLDEPLSALDLRHQFEVMTMLRQETRARRLVTLMVAHDLNIALRHADHAIVLLNGGMVVEGAPAEVLTGDTLATVYGVRGRIVRCDRGLPYVMIDDALPERS